MINAATIMKHTMEWLQDDQNLQGAIFSRSEFVNEDPSQALNGWVGLYRRSVDYDREIWADRLIIMRVI